MAKKFRKTPPRRADRAPGDPEVEMVRAAESEIEESTDAAEEPTPPAAPGASPLEKAQERELEMMLGTMGAFVGGLSGFSQTTMDATQGDPSGAVAGAILGWLLGLGFGRSLFVSARAQWIVWGMLGLATWGGLKAQGLWGAAIAVLAVTAWVGVAARGGRRAGAASEPGPSTEQE